jgi:hypothetical protein
MLQNSTPTRSTTSPSKPDRTCVRPVKVVTRRQPTVRPARLSNDPRTVGLLTLQAEDMLVSAGEACA